MMVCDLCRQPIDSVDEHPEAVVYHMDCLLKATEDLRGPKREEVADVELVGVRKRK